MKRKTIVRSIVALVMVTAIIVLAGCPAESTVSISDRINQLQVDLNSNYSSVYLNWHPDSTTRSLGADSSTLETAFPSEESGTYAITNITVTSESGDDGEATATISSSVKFGTSGISATFDMRKDGDDWFILELTAGSTNLPNIVVR